MPLSLTQYGYAQQGKGYPAQNHLHYKHPNDATNAALGFDQAPYENIPRSVRGEARASFLELIEHLGAKTFRVWRILCRSRDALGKTHITLAGVQRLSNRAEESLVRRSLCLRSQDDLTIITAEQIRYALTRLRQAGLVVDLGFFCQLLPTANKETRWTKAFWREIRGASCGGAFFEYADIPQETRAWMNKAKNYGGARKGAGRPADIEAQWDRVLPKLDAQFADIEITQVSAFWGCEVCRIVTKTSPQNSIPTTQPTTEIQVPLGVWDWEACKPLQPTTEIQVPLPSKALEILTPGLFSPYYVGLEEPYVRISADSLFDASHTHSDPLPLCEGVVDPHRAPPEKPRAFGNDTEQPLPQHSQGLAALAAAHASQQTNAIAPNSLANGVNAAWVSVGSIPGLKGPLMGAGWYDGRNYPMGFASPIEFRDLIPEYPGIGLVPLAAVPSPPALDADAPLSRSVGAMLKAYRGAALARLAMEVPESSLPVWRRAEYGQLVLAAKKLIEHGIAPAEWVVFGFDVWARFVVAKDTDRKRSKLPSIRWLFNAERIEKWRGWCSHTNGVTGGEIVYSNEQRELYQRYQGMQTMLVRRGWELHRGLVARIVHHWFPDGLYEKLVTAAQTKVRTTQERLRSARDRGVWLW